MGEVQVPDVIAELPSPVSDAQKVAVGIEAAPASTEETTRIGKKRNITGPLFAIFYDTRHVFTRDELGREILRIAIPAALALTADPIASLIDTAFIGRLGPVELAAVGVAISVFNQVSRITVFPIASITTAAVAEDVVNQRGNAKEPEVENLEKGLSTCKEMELIPECKTGNTKEPEVENLEKGPTTCKEMELIPECDTEKTVYQPSSNTIGKSKCLMFKTRQERMNIPAASSALIVSGILGIVQTLFLIFASKPLLNVMGIRTDSDMMQPGRKYLILRALGSPAVLLSLALQGIFRGFKDTKTPLYWIAAGDLLNVILDPILIFVLRLGVSGAALAHCSSQYFISLVLLWILTRKVDLFAPSFQDLKLGKFFKDSFLLLLRVIAVTSCVTVGTSMAARLGADPMAAFNVCLQIWLTTSLLADGLAVGGQAILATAFAEKNYVLAKQTAARVLQMSIVMGFGLALFLGVGLLFGAEIFTSDKNVIRIIHIGIPFVAVTQPLNTLAFVYDGVIYGVSDYAYSALSMIPVAVLSIVAIIFLASGGFVGIWTGLTVYMALRVLAGFVRMGSGTGPWSFLRKV